MDGDGLSDDDLRKVIRVTLSHEPGATLTQVQNHLRAKLGRSLTTEEAQRLHDLYTDEGYAGGAATVLANREAQAASLASLSHARPRPRELVGLAAGIIPFFAHFQSGAAARPGGQAAATYFDLIAVMGGLVALFAGLGAAMALERGPQRPAHLGLVGGALILGAYQVVVGLGLLHKIGLLPYAG